MRQLYNVFDPTKITRETIRVALQLKKQLSLNIQRVELRTADSNLVTIEQTGFLEWMCAKYLHLSLEDGLPLFKQAMKQQYHVEDSFRLCKYCGKPFPFTRATKEFCDSKCRKRFERKGEVSNSSVSR